LGPEEAENIWGTENSHRVAWFPDLINKLNCVQGRNYENWMQEDGFGPYYLFDDPAECCEKWYPARGSSCPDSERAVTPEAEDEPWLSNPYSMDNYYYPDFSRNSCGYGRDYPAWMGWNAYEKHYLFREGWRCCSKFFPTMTGNCPYEHTEQLDYYWTNYEDNIDNLDDMPIIYNHTYYPDINSGTCVNGVIQGDYPVQPCATNRPDQQECNETAVVINTTEALLSMWYPDIDGNECQNDGNMPKWMLIEGYRIWYLFNSRQQCEAAFLF
jgi:hypothetical protein